MLMARVSFSNIYQQVLWIKYVQLQSPTLRPSITNKNTRPDLKHISPTPRPLVVVAFILLGMETSFRQSKNC